MNQNEIVAALSAAIGAEQVLHDDTSRAHFSHDLFHSGLPPACVVVPRTPEDVVDAVRVATTAGHPVVPRGGGMSYTGGYVANDDKAVMFDLRRLDRVLEIDEVNRFVTVEADCTWAKLHEALAAKGLRTPYWGPLSGKKATIGGTLSQNSVFFGSVRHGSAAESVLSVDVVLADGACASRLGW
ncbi:FAD-binding oxidoreductase [Candidatus Aalborgicola defluviihabitans]|uniref:FAD-binding oxidoreductase n=1 Tax=Candidatus Aalborgicola defluviihabitans TaxID=3386187 RepID=UPI001D59189F|nr:FAD-binding oxidoreductase [Burkholderiales bacterium]